MGIAPEEMLRRTLALRENIEEAKTLVVKVGLPIEKVSSKAYGNNLTVIQNGAIHEYGLGNAPQRSFLNVPFSIKNKSISDFIAEQFIKVKDGKDAKRMLSQIGVFATNISKEAFVTDGFGTWPALKSETIKAKGSSRPLIDKGILRQSITWVVTKK